MCVCVCVSVCVKGDTQRGKYCNGIVFLTDLLYHDFPFLIFLLFFAMPIVGSSKSWVRQK